MSDLTNREELIFADTEGNVCTELVLSGTLAKEFAGMMSPNRYYVLPHAFISKIGGRDSNTRNSGALGKYDSLVTGKKEKFFSMS